MSLKLSVSGVAELDKCLKGMTKVLQDNLLKNAHTIASKPMVDSAKALVPVGETGNLKKSIGIERVSVSQAGEIGVIRIGPRRRGGFKGYHGHLIEYGKTNPGGRSRTKPYPFMEMAYNARRTEVEKNISFYVGKKIAEHIVRNVKK